MIPAPQTIDYSHFLNSKVLYAKSVGIDISEEALNKALYDAQAASSKWAISKGRAALFLDTGFGKTRIILEFAYHLAVEQGKRALIVCPLSAKKRWQDAFVVGVELNNDMPLHNWYDWNIRGNFLDISFDDRFDLVIGNPPYSEAEAFVRQSLALLRPDGWLIFLLRLQFAESLTRFLLFTQEAPPRAIVTCADRPSFTGDGKTDASAYAYFVWQKGYCGKTVHDWIVADPVKAGKQVYQRRLFE